MMSIQSDEFEEMLKSDEIHCMRMVVVKISSIL